MHIFVHMGWLGFCVALLACRARWLGKVVSVHHHHHHHYHMYLNIGIYIYIHTHTDIHRYRLTYCQQGSEALHLCCDLESTGKGLLVAVSAMRLCVNMTPGRQSVESLCRKLRCKLCVSAGQPSISRVASYMYGHKAFKL